MGLKIHREQKCRCHRIPLPFAFAKACLPCVVLLGTCMVIGDGILTPRISDVVVMISVAILAILFSVQKLGTDKVGYTFAPTILTWYLSIGIIGIYDIFHHDSSVLKAFNPIYIVHYFNSSPKEAWISLGGVVLCITGTETMFTDLVHLSVKPIEIAFTGLVHSCLICAYVGQAAYLSNFRTNVGDAFYISTPGGPHDTIHEGQIYIPEINFLLMFICISVTAAFKHFTNIGNACGGPRHTIHEGQIYIPKINFLLMFVCISVTAAFKDFTNIGNACGIAVVSVTMVTLPCLS